MLTTVIEDFLLLETPVMIRQYFAKTGLKEKKASRHKYARENMRTDLPQ